MTWESFNICVTESELCIAVVLLKKGQRMMSIIIRSIFTRKGLIAAIPEMDPAKRFEKTHLRQAINEEYRTRL